jgi:imidazole glycerol-phosphate synthase subunit HisF
MLKHRLIPVVLMRHSQCVQSKLFQRHQILGNPLTIVQRLSDWAADELIFLDISNDASSRQQRTDVNFKSHGDALGMIEDVARRAFMPLTVGGGIRTVRDVADRLERGADKVSLNSAAIEDPGLIENCAREFGSQCIVISIDVRVTNNSWMVYSWRKRTTIDLDAVEWARKASLLGAGEILLNSVDRDGCGTGYELDLIQDVVSTVPIPVIALGGVGTWDHLGQGLEAGASAVAAGNIFHYTENSVMNAKRYVHGAGYNVRGPDPES